MSETLKYSATEKQIRYFVVFVLCFLAIFSPAAAQSGSGTRPGTQTLICYDEMGNQRNSATSVSTDLCYDAFRNPTTLTFGAYLLANQIKQQTVTAPVAPIATADNSGVIVEAPLGPMSVTPTPTETLAVPETDTPEPATETPAVPETDTPEPATETPAVPGTDTPEPATETPAVPVTNTPEPTATAPTNTALPPTAIPTNTALPPTATTGPTGTATQIPVPGKPILISPNAEYTTRTQTFSWHIAAHATRYRLNWKNEWGNSGSTDLNASDPACGVNHCSLTIVLPIEGKYTWTVSAFNAGSSSTVSDTMEFRVNPNITTPDGILPSGWIGNRQWVSFVFNDVRDNVKEYNIQIYDQNKNVVLDAKRTVENLKYANDRVTFNVYVDLPRGTYNWRVRGRSDNSLSNWSAPIEIRTDGYYNPPYRPTYLPTAVYNYDRLSIISPIGNVSDPTLTVSWKPVAGASYYTIKVYNSNNAEIYNADVQLNACNWTSCTATPGFSFPAAGTYRIYVASKSQTGANWGDGSVWITYGGTGANTNLIQIRPGTTPQPPVTAIRFLAPANNEPINAKEAVISWIDQGENVKYYEVKISDSSGTTLLDTTLDRSTAYCNGKNCAIVFDEIDPGDDYKLLLVARSESGERGDPSELTFNVVEDDLPMRSLYPKKGETTAQRPYFSWGLPTGTQNAETFMYALKLVSTTNKTETIYSELVCDDPRVGCFNGGASFILTENLPSGEYIWQVQNKETNLTTEEEKFIVP